MYLFSLAPFFIPFLLVFIVAVFIQGTQKHRFISCFLLILALLSFYKAFEAGMALKNTEILFVQNNRGKYAKYSDLEKNAKIRELKKKQKNRKISFITFSILYWLGFLGMAFITWKVSKYHRV